jgi:hypothetical protein
METLVYFNSQKFAPNDQDAEHMINEDVWGHELVTYLAEALRQSGIETKDFFAEDWGWGVPLRNPYKMWIGCGHIGHPPYDSGAFAVFFGPEKFVRRALQATDEAHTELLRLKAILDKSLQSDPDISGLSWEVQRL